MTGSSGSASNSAEASSGRPVLIVSTNWIGDVLMSMPAVQEFGSRFPQIPVQILCRPFLRPLWQMHGHASEVFTYTADVSSLIKLPSQLSDQGIETAYVLPNSVRSALAARMSGARIRIGFEGPGRWLGLNRRLPRTEHPDRVHQAWEMMEILGVGQDLEILPVPALTLPPVTRAWAASVLSESERWIGFIPAAARGSSKEWPMHHFRELGCCIVRMTGARIALFGGPEDVERCESLRSSIGHAAVSFAGTTSLDEWGALMACCRAVIANDSGGMHYAAALGIGVVALYGITDPAKTGPLGPHCRVLKKSQNAARDVSRSSEEARIALEAIKPGDVWDTLRELLMELEREPADA